MMSKVPGECIEQGPRIADMDFAQFRMRVSTDRYYCPEFHARERERLWMRVWQVAGRPDEIPHPGDWTEYRIFDQSYLLVRGKDEVIRGFVNACRHRGFAVCEGKGRSARFTCPYHNWSYGLDGKLLAVAKPDFDGPVEDFVGLKEELGLRQVSVDCFAGFIFLNPDPGAAPLREYLGELVELVAPYHMEEMVPVGFNVRETVDCNWKVVMDAFQEAYHIQGIHPDLIPTLDETKQRYGFFGDHTVSSGPFGAANLENHGPEDQANAMRQLTINFPGISAVLPRFDELLDAHRDPNGVLTFPEGTNTRLLFQEATRDTLTAKGLDLSGLTDSQMIDSHFDLIFPNLFISARAGEALVIISTPHPDGNPNRCQWWVLNLAWLPPEQRDAASEPLIEIAEGDHYPYFITLEQDWQTMPRQQRGLRNRKLGHMSLTRQEVRLAYYHSVLDSWLDSSGTEARN